MSDDCGPARSEPRGAECVVRVMVREDDVADLGEAAPPNGLVHEPRVKRRDHRIHEHGAPHRRECGAVHPPTRVDEVAAGRQHDEPRRERRLAETQGRGRGGHPANSTRWGPRPPRAERRVNIARLGSSPRRRLPLPRAGLREFPVERAERPVAYRGDRVGQERPGRSATRPRPAGASNRWRAEDVRSGRQTRRGFTRCVCRAQLIGV